MNRGRQALIYWEKHFDFKTTITFQLDGVKYVVNGCQFFKSKNRHRVYNEFDVCLDKRKQVDEGLNNLNSDINTEEIVKILTLRPDLVDFFLEKNLITDEVVEKVIMKDIYFYAFIPPEFKTEEMNLKIVRDDPRNIAHIPLNKRTLELCLEVVRVGIEKGCPWAKNVRGQEVTEKLHYFRYWTNWKVFQRHIPIQHLKACENYLYKV